ncbi:MAG: HipA N-terminal domain-containing protein [Polyangia bacterium]
MTDELNVFFSDRIVGKLVRRANGRMAFRYSEKWLSSKEAFPISLSLPLGEEICESDRVSGFFGNLLPA